MDRRVDVLKFKTIEEGRAMIALLIIAFKHLPKEEVLHLKPAMGVLTQFVEFLSFNRTSLGVSTLSWAVTNKRLTQEQLKGLKRRMGIRTIDANSKITGVISEDTLQRIADSYKEEVRFHERMEMLPSYIDYRYGLDTRVRMMGPSWMKPTIGILSSYANKQDEATIDNFVRELQKINPILLSFMEGIRTTTYGLAVRLYDLAIIIPPKTKDTCDEHKQKQDTCTTC